VPNDEALIILEDNNATIKINPWEMGSCFSICTPFVRKYRAGFLQTDYMEIDKRLMYLYLMYRLVN